MFTKFPGDDLIGYTYDIFGLYADPQSALKNVLAEAQQVRMIPLGNNTYPVPQGVDLVTDAGTSVTTVAGESYREFSGSLNARVNLRVRMDGFFARTKNKFSASVRGDSKTMYSLLFDFTKLGLARISDVSKVALDPDLLSALNDSSLAASDLFRRWGTHLCVGVVLGGSVRHYTYAKKTDAYGEASFESDSRARYVLISGSINVDASASATVDNVVDVGSLQIAGGTIQAQAALQQSQDFQPWVDSVASQPAVIDFADNGMLPLWELCDDQSRASELQSEFSRLYSPVRSGGSWTVYQDNGGYEDESLVKTDDTDEFATGVAGRIKNGNFAVMALQVENGTTGQRRWIYAGSSDDHSVEQSWEAPTGCALTGLAMRCNDDDLKNLRVYYQCLDLGSSGSNGSCLDRSVFTVDVPESSGWEVDTKTSDGNQNVLAGIQSRVHDDDIKSLQCLESTLILPVNSAA